MLREYCNVTISNADNIDIQDSGEVYISSDTIESNKGYLLGNDMLTFKTSIGTGPVGVYDQYGWYVKDLSARTISKVSLINVCVDYVKPTVTLASSNTSIKINKQAKNVYTVNTNKIATFNLKTEFGVSGKQNIRYKVVKKGVKNTDVKWKTLLSGSTIKVKPGSWARLYVQCTDSAGNVTTVKTVGFRGDYSKPKITATDKAGNKITKTIKVR